MKRFITSIWILAFVIAVPIILVLPDFFEKYLLELEKAGFAGNLNNNPKVYFEDLDADGQLEQIESFRQPQANAFSFQYFGADGGMIDQVNFPGVYDSRTDRLYFADADKEGHKEVYAFSFENDSLILRWIQLTPKEGGFHRLPICELRTYRDSLYDYTIGDVHCLDIDNDEQKELVFAITGGYSIVPRQIFKVDIVNRKVYQSENTGCANTILKFADLNGDGKLEIIGEGEVPPIREEMNLPFNKPAPYLKVLDADLNYFFPPIKFYSGIQGMTRTFIVQNNQGKELLCAFLSSSSECPPLVVYRINPEGEIKDSLLLSVNEKSRYKSVFQNEKGNYLSPVGRGILVEFASDLKVVGEHDLGLGSRASFCGQYDLNKDGLDEMFFRDYSGKTFYVFSDHFRWRKQINFQEVHYSPTRMNLGENKFYLANKTGYKIYSFTKNPLYLLRFPVYLGIYLLSVLLVYSFQKIIETRLKERYELNSRLNELQMRTFRNQLDPHFIFNTFNTIASVVKQGRNEEAYGIFMKFSKLFRLNLENTEDILISLRDEIDVVKNYLDIQRFRFGDLFNYEVNIANEFDCQIRIPRMLIQVHVENAIYHGLKPKKEKGKLSVNVSGDSKKIEIEITDNGIGRKKAKELKTGNTGLGIKTISKYIEVYNQQFNKKLKQEIIDLEKNGKAVGTKVKLCIVL